MRIKIIRFILALLVICFLVIPVDFSAGQSVLVTDDVDCDWMCWGGNPANTFAVADECAPDINNMKLLWSFDIFTNFSTSLIKNDYLYIFERDKIHCVDMNGDLVWTKEDHDYQDMVLTNYGVVTSFKEELENTRIRCLNFFDGTEVWCTEPSTFPYQPDLFSNGELIFVETLRFDSDNLVMYYKCLNSQSGDFEYEIPIEGYIGLRYGIFSNDSFIARKKREAVKLFSWNLENGEQQWVFDCSEGFELNYTPIYYEDCVYAIEYQNKNSEDEEEAENCKLLCISEETGKTMWTVELDCKKAALEGISKGLIFITEYDKGMSCYSIETKEKLWFYGHNGCYSSTAISNNMIFFSSIVGEELSTEKDSNIHCLNTKTGKELWTTKEPGRYISIMISDGKLFSDNCSPEGSFISEDPIPFQCWGTPPPEGTLYRLTIKPSGVVINDDQKYQFLANGVDSGGNVLKAEVDWSIDPPSAGTITKDGLFTPGEEADKCVIKAVAEGKTAIAQVTIVHAVEIKVDPETVNLRPGETAIFTSKAIDRKGIQIIGVPLIWSLSNPLLGELSPVGKFTAGKTGGISGKATCKFAGLKGIVNINILDTSMESAISFEPETINLGKLSSGNGESFEVTLKNHVSVPVSVDIQKFGAWFEVGRKNIIIQANEEKKIRISVTPEKLETGVLFIGKLRASWEGGQITTQVMVEVE